MLVLGIESSCDETACSVVLSGEKILSNVVASQSDLHASFGGVVPELASRLHIELIMPTVHEALSQAGCSLNDIDLFAATQGPGLIGSLMIGLCTAKALAIATNKPFIGVNHVEAHLYAALMSLDREQERLHRPAFPCLGVILSGGHTSLLIVKEIGSYELIGQTIDDAIGEAFDKVAKMLALPYPGGPEIEKLALKGNPDRFPFKAGRVKERAFDFSFSGLKTAVLYTLRDLPSGEGSQPSYQELCDIAASFQRAAFDDVVKKTVRAAEEKNISSIIFGGGVTNNRHLRACFAKHSLLDLFWPSFELSLDNAAMIAGLGFCYYQKRGQGDFFDLDPLTRIPFYS